MREVRKSGAKGVSPRAQRGGKPKPAQARVAPRSKKRPTGSGYDLTFRPLGAAPITRRAPLSLAREAIRWSYVVRIRQRWLGNESVERDQEERCRRTLRELGLDAAELDLIAAAGLVEVEIPYVAEEIGWEARIFPWEFVLSTATRGRRRGTQLTVLRWLNAGTPKLARSTARSDLHALYVESAPGDLRSRYEFDAEAAMIARRFEPSLTRLLDPSASELRETIERLGPGVVHLTGFDVHQGLELLNEEDNGVDGYLLRCPSTEPPDASKGYAVSSALQMMELLAPGGRSAPSPELVTFNLWNSASRVAALSVAAGVGAAIGVQDDLDDRLAEFFFAVFYEKWNGPGDTLEAFRRAWSALASQPDELRGTGIVLWSASSLVPTTTKASTKSTEARSKEKTLMAAPASLLEARQLIDVEVTRLEGINYSLLHNHKPIFERFRLMSRAESDVVLCQVGVEVELVVGTNRYAYRSTLDLTHDHADLAPKVHLPLTWASGPLSPEPLRSSMFVRVSWGPHEIFRDTLRVTLRPMDEWTDDERDRHWLPSFVLPRDPAIESILEEAQPHLNTLADDPSAGFDGYQSVDRAAPASFRAVHAQVQAIWSAISRQHGLGYVNPPPTYAWTSQRLRSPSEILRARRGTCIDLSLLLAACLEYIGIFPVLFLFNGHACAGYWRDEDAHRRFFSPREEEEEGYVERTRGLEHVDTRGLTQGPRVPWLLPRGSYRLLRDLLEHGILVPLEATLLTERASFHAACEEGSANFAQESDFHSMIDVVKARTEGVTPLPIGVVRS